MKVFKKVDSVFIKSNNTTMKIFNRYLFCLFPFMLLLFFYNFIWGNRYLSLNLITNIFVSIIFGFITGYICNLLKKQKDIKSLFFKDQILIISIIVGLFSAEMGILITIIASCVSVIIKSFIKDITLSSSLYGILVMLLISYFNGNVDNPLNHLSELSYIGSYDKIMMPFGSILSYVLGFKYYLSPILALVSFIYLFIKKSIKYNIVISYLLTFSFIIFIFGIFNGMNIWYILFHLCTGDILFLTVFCLTDYPNTPIIYEGQIIYGIIIGILTAILRFIVPSLSVVISFILGNLVISKLVDKISIKLKYNKKLFYLFLVVSALLILFVCIILNIVY